MTTSCHLSTTLDTLASGELKQSPNLKCESCNWEIPFNLIFTAGAVLELRIRFSDAYGSVGHFGTCFP